SAFVDCVGLHESSSPDFNPTAGDSFVRLATKSLTTSRDELHESSGLVKPFPWGDAETAVVGRIGPLGGSPRREITGVGGLAPMAPGVLVAGQ
ncbi:MAG: hypothetical protein RIC55_33335, partial [Pirellulaceae bacterium]